MFFCNKNQPDAVIVITEVLPSIIRKTCTLSPARINFITDPLLF